MEIIKIKEQSINAEESKLYKKVLDSLGVIYETEKIKKSKQMFLSTFYLKSQMLGQIML